MSTSCLGFLGITFGRECGFRIFSSSYIFKLHLKSARLVGVFKTEKRKRESERETRDVFGRERFCARVLDNTHYPGKRGVLINRFGLDTETSQHDEKYTAERVDVWVRHGVRRRVVSNHQSIERWCKCRRRGLYFFFIIFERW